MVESWERYLASLTVAELDHLLMLANVELQKRADEAVKQLFESSGL